MALLLGGPAWSHTVEHKVSEQGAVVVTVFLGDEVASYSEYEVLAPESEEPFQLGRLDEKGRVAFLPSRAGLWKVKVSADSQHGLHGVVVEVNVDKDMVASSRSQPPIARSTRLVVGVSLLFGIFGLFSLLKNRRRSSGE